MLTRQAIYRLMGFARRMHQLTQPRPAVNGRAIKRRPLKRPEQVVVGKKPGLAGVVNQAGDLSPDGLCQTNAPVNSTPPSRKRPGYKTTAAEAA
ncbi:MAG: hypothetical protein H6668_19350 [Ardenticatenaceae bacterium]|nr:hypothetical protein [Ardenticatenaceae bacterium]